MMIWPEIRHYSVFDLLIEFKYVPLKALQVGGRRLTGQEVGKKSRNELVSLSAVKKEFAEAKAQLRNYRQTLE